MNVNKRNPKFFICFRYSMKKSDAIYINQAFELPPLLDEMKVEVVQMLKIYLDGDQLLIKKRHYKVPSAFLLLD